MFKGVTRLLSESTETPTVSVTWVKTTLTTDERCRLLNKEER